LILDLLNLLNYHIISILMLAGSVWVGTILSFWHVYIDCYQASRQIMHEDLVLPALAHWNGGFRYIFMIILSCLFTHHPRETLYLVVAQHFCLGLNSHCPRRNWVPTMMDQEPTVIRGATINHCSGKFLISRTLRTLYGFPLDDPQEIITRNCQL
jgi:hypothetical protein